MYHERYFKTKSEFTISHSSDKNRWKSGYVIIRDSRYRNVFAEN